MGTCFYDIVLSHYALFCGLALGLRCVEETCPEVEFLQILCSFPSLSLTQTPLTLNLIFTTYFVSSWQPNRIALHLKNETIHKSS